MDWKRKAVAPSLLSLAVWTVAALAPAAAEQAEPKKDIEKIVYAAPGLREPVRILVDRWGVPHIYAKNTSDVFFAQGFNIARDRLFQIDLWLRKGLGRLSEAFGPSLVDQDRAARLFLYRGDMEREWASYGPEGKDAATRFAAGINAYVDYLKAHPQSLPEEFKKLGYTPARWRPEDVVRIRTHGISHNIESEVSRAGVACAAGDASADQVRIGLQPAHEAVLPAGFDPCSLPGDVLDVYSLGKGEVRFANGKLQQVPMTPRTSSGGSNGWVIAPARTATGRPILANDPHRAMPAPSSRYIAHLNAPGLNAIGAGEAFAPGLSLGHNDTASFGLTIFQIDQEDLYVYDLDPANPKRYRYGNGWEDIRTVKESVAVAGGPAVPVELSYTRHGPLIKIDAQHNKAYALRAAWLMPGMSPYFGSMRYLRARNFNDYKQAIQHWGAPPLNHIYADTAGNIGWVAGGGAPRRVGYDGLMPVPGDGRYEWNGLYAGSELPSEYNPARGFFATANEFNLPANYPADRRLSFEWADPSRFKRISQVLAANAKSSIADSTTLQNDRYSVVAPRLLAVLKTLPADSPIAPALAVLKDWNGVDSEDSAAAALFETWLMGHLGPQFPYRLLPPDAAQQIPIPDLSVVLTALENPTAWFGEDGVAVRNQLIEASLSGAYTDVAAQLGTDPTTWRWGDLHNTVFRHPAAALADEATAKRWNVGPLKQGGSWQTVNMSVFNPFDIPGSPRYEQWVGPSFRMAIDVGNWDASRAVNAPGQSGDPASASYRDLAPMWREGRYFPLLYSRNAVQLNATREILLTP